MVSSNVATEDGMQSPAQLLRLRVRGQWEWLRYITDAQVNRNGRGLSEISLEEEIARYSIDISYGGSKAVHYSIYYYTV